MGFLELTDTFLELILPPLQIYATDKNEEVAAWLLN